MAPSSTSFRPISTLLQQRQYNKRNVTFDASWRKNAVPADFVIEAWSEGCMFGALLIMACTTVAGMRKGVLLHKLILLELVLAIWHGTFCFMSFDGYGWYLSSTAALMYCSWFVHNVVAWIKVKPFFDDPRSSLFPASVNGKLVAKVYLVTLALTIPVILLQAVCNFLFFNNIYGLYAKIRPAEPAFRYVYISFNSPTVLHRPFFDKQVIQVFRSSENLILIYAYSPRDPWWLFSCFTLFHVIRKCYGFSVIGLIRKSPRLGILLAAICLAMIFTLLDIIASAIPEIGGSVEGINPYWKLSLIFKCLTDNIMLDDFSTELKRLGGGSGGGGGRLTAVELIHDGHDRMTPVSSPSSAALKENRKNDLVEVEDAGLEFGFGRQRTMPSGLH